MKTSGVGEAGIENCKMVIANCKLIVPQFAICILKFAICNPAGRMALAAALFLGLASLGQSEERVPFREGVLAALSRQGCSAGACHGSPTGKGGFRLSLRGFDAVLDEQTLIREDFGRRVNPQDPDASLILLKPLMQVSHGGGQKLRKSDAAYAIIREWIAQGARPNAANTPVSLRIEVTRKSLELQHPNWTQQIAVRGHYSDGSVRDVTHLAVFSSSDESIAAVNAGGVVTGISRGEATILVRVLDHIETVSLLFPRTYRDSRGSGRRNELHRPACLGQIELQLLH
jgi:hypothetical protein